MTREWAEFPLAPPPGWGDRLKQKFETGSMTTYYFLVKNDLRYVENYDVRAEAIIFSFQFIIPYIPILLYIYAESMLQTIQQVNQQPDKESENSKRNAD